MITRSIGISKNNSPEKYKKKFLEMTSWLLKIIKNEKTAKNTVMVLKLLVMDFSYPEGLPILKSLPSKARIDQVNIIKKNSLDIKKDIVEHLWKVIISDNSVDQYESNLMRRICGLIYFPDKELSLIHI